jgi:hypothetical protein
LKKRGLVGRTSVYSLVGLATEIAFSALHDVKRGKPVKLRTSPWMLPIYALIAPLYEPLHRRLARQPVHVRAAAYGAGFLAVEYTTGTVFRIVRGEAPWDYTYARVHLHGLIRPEYFFFWAAAGLALEHLHSELTKPEDLDGPEAALAL